MSKELRTAVTVGALLWHGYAAFQHLKQFRSMPSAKTLIPLLLAAGVLMNDFRKP